MIRFAGMNVLEESRRTIMRGATICEAKFNVGYSSSFETNKLQILSRYREDRERMSNDTR